MAGLLRGVRPIGRWSMSITLSICAEPVQRAVRARRGASTACSARASAGIEDVVHERRLAGARDAGHRDEHAERELDVDVLQVVLARAARS